MKVHKIFENESIIVGVNYYNNKCYLINKLSQYTALLEGSFDGFFNINMLIERVEINFCKFHDDDDNEAKKFCTNCGI